MNYAERAYFDGDHCHHCYTWQEHKRTVALRRKAFLAVRAGDSIPRAYKRMPLLPTHGRYI